VVTHQLQVERRTAKAHRPKTNALPLDHVRHQHRARDGEFYLVHRRKAVNHYSTEQHSEWQSTSHPALATMSPDVQPVANGVGWCVGSAWHQTVLRSLHLSAGWGTSSPGAIDGRAADTRDAADFIHPSLWPLNSPDLNPVKYTVWGVLKERVYREKIWTVEELQQSITECVWRTFFEHLLWM